MKMKKISKFCIFIVKSNMTVLQKRRYLGRWYFLFLISRLSCPLNSQTRNPTFQIPCKNLFDPCFPDSLQTLSRGNCASTAKEERNQLVDAAFEDLEKAEIPHRVAVINAQGILFSVDLYAVERSRFVVVMHVTYGNLPRFHRRTKFLLSLAAFVSSNCSRHAKLDNNVAGLQFCDRCRMRQSPDKLRQFLSSMGITFTISTSL